MLLVTVSYYKVHFSGAREPGPTSGVVFIFGEAGLKVVQVSPQVVLLQFVADRLHLGQLVQQGLVLLLYQLAIKQGGWKVEMESGRLTEPAGCQERSEPLCSRQGRM